MCVYRRNTTLDGTPGKVDPSSVKLPPNEDLPPAEVEQDLDEVAYVDRKKGDDDDDDDDDDDADEDEEEEDEEDNSRTDDDDWDDLSNDAALNDLKTFNINLHFWHRNDDDWVRLASGWTTT